MTPFLPIAVSSGRRSVISPLCHSEVLRGISPDPSEYLGVTGQTRSDRANGIATEAPGRLSLPPNWPTMAAANVDKLAWRAGGASPGFAEFCPPVFRIPGAKRQAAKDADSFTVA